MLDMFEKKSREVSAEPLPVSRPAQPYDGGDSDGGSVDGDHHKVSDDENFEDDDDDDDIV